MREDKGLTGLLKGFYDAKLPLVINDLDYNLIMKEIEKLTSITTSNTQQQNITTLANDRGPITTGGPINTAVWPNDSTPNQMTLTNDGGTQTQSNWSNTSVLSVEKRNGINTLIRWVECNSAFLDYKIGSRSIEAYIVLDQLKKILIIDSYDRTDKVLLNDLRTLYIKDNGSK